MNQIHIIRLLYGFELKKIFMRKTTWIILGIMTVLSVWIPFADLSSIGYSIDGKDISGYEMMLMDRDAARKLSGRVIDDQLLKEMQSAYHRNPKEDNSKEQADYTVDFSTGMESAFVSGDGEDSPEHENINIDGTAHSYSPVLSYITKIVENSNLALEVDETQLYQERRNGLSQTWNDQLLTEDEIAYWTDQEAQITVPFTYEYAGGWDALFEHIFPLNFMLLLLIAVCLSNVFSTEHLHRTNQLILSSRYGKTPLYLAKLSAGLTFGISCAFLLFLGNASACIRLYGADGLHAALQNVLPASSRPVSVGRAVLILFGLFLTVSMLYSIVTMFLSEWLKRSAAVMAILTGFMLLTMMFDIPYSYRIASQAYDLLPTTLLVEWQFWDDRLFSVFGTYLTNFQIAWTAYFMIGILLAWMGKRLYVRISRQ